MIIQAMRIFLTGIYILFAAFTVVIIMVEIGPYYLFVTAALHLGVVAALNNKGGAGVRVLSLVTAGLQTVAALGALGFAVYSGFFGTRFELGMFMLAIAFSVIGMATLHVLRNIKTMTTLG